MENERVLPPDRCSELKEAGYPQGDSRLVWVFLKVGSYDLLQRHEAPSFDNQIDAMTTNEANKWTFENGFLTPDQCEEIRSEGFTQGRSKYLWHKDKHQRDRWVIYKRTPHDMSQYADKSGYNRWVTAVTHEQAACFRERNKPKEPINREVDFLTFKSGQLPDPRKSACLFAATIDLISITESWSHIYLHVTVYYWKDE